MVLVKDATIDAAMWAGVVVAAGSSLPPTARSECGDVVRSCDEVIRTLRGYEGCTWEDAEVWVVVDDIVRGIMEDAAMWARAAVAAGLSLNASAGECDDVIRICDDVMRTLHGIQSCACDDAKVWAEVTSAAGLNLQIYAAPRLVVDATMSAPTVMEHRRDEPDIDELSSKDTRCTNASPPSPEPQPTNLASQVTSDMSRPGQRSHLRSLRLLARLPRVSRLVDSPHVPHRRIAPTAERFCRPSAAWLDNYREDRPRDGQRESPVIEQTDTKARCALGAAHDEPSSCQPYAVQGTRASTPRSSALQQQTAQLSAAARSSQAKEAKAEQLQEQQRQHSGLDATRSAPALPAAHRPGLQIGATYTSHELLDAILYKPALIPKGSTTTRRPTSRNRHGALSGARQHRSAPLLALEPAAIPWEGRLAGRAESDLLVTDLRAPSTSLSSILWGCAPQYGTGTSTGYGTGTSTASSGRQHRQPPPARSHTGPSFLDPYDQCTRYGYIDQFRKIGESSSSIESRPATAQRIAIGEPRERPSARI